MSELNPDFTVQDFFNAYYEAALANVYLPARIDGKIQVPVGNGSVRSLVGYSISNIASTSVIVGNVEGIVGTPETRFVGPYNNLLSEDLMIMRDTGKGVIWFDHLLHGATPIGHELGMLMTYSWYGRYPTPANDSLMNLRPEERYRLRDMHASLRGGALAVSKAIVRRPLVVRDRLRHS